MKVLIFSLLLKFHDAAPLLNPSTEEGVLFQGDIQLTPAQMHNILKSRRTFSAVEDVNLWMTDGKAETIKYYIGNGLWFAESAIEEAIAGYQQNTCLKFERVRREPRGPHITFGTGRGCNSPLGKQQTVNKIYLDWGCLEKGAVQHEIGHTLGFHHEQSRPDRDEYVEVMWDNILRTHHYNYMKYNFDTLGLGYDYDSMMHYGPYYFSKDPKHKLLTLRTKDPKAQHRIGQRVGMSPLDIAKLKKMYKC